MKNLLITILLLCSIVGYSQPAVVNRSSDVIVASDGGIIARNTMRPPVYQDTTAANSSSFLLDSCGRQIFTYSDNSYWLRECNPKRWVRLLKDGDATNVFASNGLSKDGDTVELGGTLNQQTDIALNSNNLRLTGTGNLVVGDAGSSTARLQVNTGSFNGPPYLQVGPLLSNSIYANIHTSDTVTSSNVSSFPLRGLQMNRNIVMQDNNLTISDKEGAFLGLVFRLKDSVRLNPLGSDLMYGVRGSINFGKYSGYSGRSIVQSGLFDFDASQGILGLIAAAGSGSNYFRLRGYYAGVTGYLIINSVDTVDNFMGFQSTGEVRGKLLKGYGFYSGGLQNCDTCWGVYSDSKGLGSGVKYNFFNDNTGIGISIPQKKLHVVGTTMITDTVTLPNIIEQTDTNSYKPVVKDVNGNIYALDRWPGRAPIYESDQYLPVSNDAVGVTSSTPDSAYYQRIGNYVKVNGSISVTSSGTTGVITLTLPIASDFTSSSQAFGTMTVSGGGAGELNQASITSDSTQNEANLAWVSTLTGTFTLFYEYMYRIF